MTNLGIYSEGSTKPPKAEAELSSFYSIPVVISSCRSHSQPKSLVASPGTAGTALSHWSNASCAMRYHIFKQIYVVDAIPVNITTDSDATLAGQPSGKTLKVYVIAANAAGQTAPSDTVKIVVP